MADQTQSASPAAARPLSERPLVAIVGRPNVGKSTLFNRIVGERRALVDNIPGLTRDRHYANAEYRARLFTLVDTGGYEVDTVGTIQSQMRRQLELAVEEADRVILLMDVHTPATPEDDALVEWLRSTGKMFALAVNKCEGSMGPANAYAEFSRWGFDQIFPISSLHGEGVFDLMDFVTDGFPQTIGDERRAGEVRVAIVGRQNVGKSTLVNRLVGEERVIASPVAGTTRDAIDTAITVEGREFTLIDTAGIRKRGRIERGAEMLSVHSSFRAIDRADVALLLIDASEGITEQDTHIAGYILEARKAVVVVLNKWDALKKDNATHGTWIKEVREKFSFMKWAPIVTISARTGQRASKLWGLITHCAEQHGREFPTRQLNLILRKATAFLSPPTTRGRELSIKYATQTGSRPVTISLFVNDPRLVHFSYQRFLANQYRMQLGLQGAPLLLKFRRKAPPRGWQKMFAGNAVAPEEDALAIAGGLEEEFVAGFYNEDDDPSTDVAPELEYIDTDEGVVDFDDDDEGDDEDED